MLAAILANGKLVQSLGAEEKIRNAQLANAEVLSALITDSRVQNALLCAPRILRRIITTPEVRRAIFNNGNLIRSIGGDAKMRNAQLGTDEILSQMVSDSRIQSATLKSPSLLNQLLQAPETKAVIVANGRLVRELAADEKVRNTQLDMPDVINLLVNDTRIHKAIAARPEAINRIFHQQGIKETIDADPFITKLLRNKSEKTAVNHRQRLERHPGGSVYDPLLGFAKQTNDIPGYDIWPTDANFSGPNLKIMISGGSTSTWPLGVWSKLLGKKLTGTGYATIIFNGGVEGYSSSQELIKSMRDMPAIKPDYLISLSGINDLGKLHCLPNHPFVHRYQSHVSDYIVDANEAFSGWNCGLPYSESSSETWLRNVTNMYNLASALGIPFLACLQPTMVYGNYAPMEEELELLSPFAERVLDTGKSYTQEACEFYDNVRSKLNSYPETYHFILDLSHLFENKSALYRDYRHQNEKGDEIIASAIHDAIAKNLPPLVKTRP